MTKRRLVTTIFLAVLPPAVLCFGYGFRLLTSTATGFAAALYALLLLILFITLYIHSVFDAEEQVLRADSPLPQPLCRERRIDAREMARITFVILCVRLFTFVLAYLWDLLVNGYSGTVFDIQHIWADHPLAARYLSMANRGYSWKTAATGLNENLVVAPLYGLAIRFLSPSAATSIKIAFAISNINAVLAGAVLYALAVKEADRRRARLAVYFYCLLPSSVFMSCTLADSTFLLLSLLTCYLIKLRYFFPAAGLGFLASLTMPQGAALLLPALLEYGIYLREKLREDKEERRLGLCIGEGISLLLIPAGWLMYIYKNAAVSGDPFMYIKLSGGYRLFFEQGADILGAVSTAQKETLFGELLPAMPALPLFFGALLLTRRQIPASLRLYALAFLLCVPNAQEEWPRILFTCFPVIFAVAELASRKRIWEIIMIPGSAALFLLRLGMYVLGWGAA